MAFAATWMHLEIIILSEVSQTERQISYISYMWNLKKILMNRYRKQTYSYQRGKMGVGRDKLGVLD